MNKSVAMLHPGELGAAIGAGFVSRAGAREPGISATNRS